MKKEIFDRVIKECKYILETGKTVREIACDFGISKSTVHKDLRDRLLEIDFSLYNDVSKILEYHTEVRHIRGGDATRRKFMEKMQISSIQKG